MPKVTVYVPEHLYRRRSELPGNKSLSSFLNDGFQSYLDEQDAAVDPKPKQGKSAAA